MAPFLAWVDRRLATIAADLDAFPLLDGKSDAYLGGPLHRLMWELGWDESSGTRRLHRWRFQTVGGKVERDAVEDALHRAGVQFGDVYPDLAPRDAGPLRDAYCPACCREVAVAGGGACPWCDATTVAARGPASRPRLGQGRKMTDAQVRAAHVLYMERELSLLALGGLLHERFGYRTPVSAASSLRRSFVLLGLPRRSQLEGQHASHVTHGLLVGAKRGKQSPKYTALRRARAVARLGYCSATTTRGARCSHVAHEDTGLCSYHEPHELARRRAQIAVVNARTPDERPPHVARCGAVTVHGKRCTRPLAPGNTACGYHMADLASLRAQFDAEQVAA